ncbi:SDR family oxidoreductase [Promineifilum sp.]|uniref:SDR family oxidoreductase n=1 Tax=Promineifilum sp. TaxID=2664178 RepID=UPI0035B4DF28
MDGRVALVTGANRGIGLEVCRQLADLGLRVILTARDPAQGEAAARQLQRDGSDVAFWPLDVTDPATVAAAQAFVEERYSRLDVLVNNAAIYPDGDRSVFDVPLETMEETLRVNFYGPLLLCRAFAPSMRRRRYGRIVNVSSNAGQLSTMGAGTPAYAISKAALNALTRIVAAEVGGHVKVNAVCPGWVRTEMGGPGAPRSVAEGADTIVWLAMLPDFGPSGGFFRDRQPIPW